VSILECWLSYSTGVGCKTLLLFFRQVQTGPERLCDWLSRSLALCSQVCVAIRLNGTMMILPSGEPLIRVKGKSSTCRLLLCQADRSVVMRCPCAGAALAPPLWIVPNKAFSEALSLSPPNCSRGGRVDRSIER
jgi:hypothetical protein